MTQRANDILKKGKVILRDHGIELFALEAELLLANLLCQNSREQLIALLDNEVDQNTENKFIQLINRRIQNEPISQILGKKEFWNYEFLVNSSVLTPRNDTETLIEQVIKYYPAQKAKLNILDLGTGSGCLSITLASIFENAKIIALDISDAAIKVAEQNAVKNFVDNRITFIKSNWFQKVPLLKFDIIVCNPPYISLKEFEELTDDVKHYEPEIALTDGADGYTCYREIANEMKNYFTPQAKAFFEVGRGQAHNVKNIFESYGFKIEIIAKDLSGIERCVVVS